MFKVSRCGNPMELPALLGLRLQRPLHQHRRLYVPHCRPLHILKVSITLSLKSHAHTLGAHYIPKLRYQKLKCKQCEEKSANKLKTDHKCIPSDLLATIPVILLLSSSWITSTTRLLPSTRQPWELISSSQGLNMTSATEPLHGQQTSKSAWWANT